MAKMREIVAKAQKRRSKLLAEFNRKPDQTIAEFAEKKSMNSVRMGQLLKKAKEEFTQ